MHRMRAQLLVRSSLYPLAMRRVQRGAPQLWLCLTAMSTASPSLLTTEAVDVADFILRAWNHDESHVKREEFSRRLAADATQDIKSVRSKLSDTMIHLSRDYQHDSIDWLYESILASGLDERQLVGKEILARLVNSLGRAGKCEKAKRLILKQVPSLGSLTAVSLIVQSACLSKNVQEAEIYFFLWLLLRSIEGSTFSSEHKIITIAARSSSTINMIKTLLNGRDSCKLYPLFYDEAPIGTLSVSEKVATILTSAFEHLELSKLAASPVDPVLWDVMMKLYAGSRSWVSCRALLAYLENPQSPERPSSVSEQVYHYSIKSLCDAKMYVEGRAVIDRMVAATGRKPSISTKSLFAKVLKSPDLPLKALESMYPQLVKTVATIGCATEPLTKITLSYPDPTLDRLDGNFPAMLRYNGLDYIVKTLTEALCRHGELGKAEQTLFFWHENNVPMSSSAFCEVIRCYASTGHVQQAMYIYNWLIAHKMTPDPMAYHQICSALRKQKDIEGLVIFMLSNKVGN